MKNNSPAGAIALGGVLAALSIVVMCLGGLIPIATYVCPMICAILLQVVYIMCGRRVAWAWYGAVSILGLLLSPDKEAAATFVFLGYYPIIKPFLDGKRGKFIWKFLFFNLSIGIMYYLLLVIVGVPGLSEEFREMGTAMTAILLLLGNVCLFLLDKVLEKPFFRGLGRNG